MMALCAVREICITRRSINLWLVRPERLKHLAALDTALETFAEAVPYPGCLQRYTLVKNFNQPVTGAFQPASMPQVCGGEVGLAAGGRALW